MSGSVLASITQNCKGCNKCFTSSPQDAIPVQGLHSNAHRAKSGAKRKKKKKIGGDGGEGGRRSGEGDSKTHAGKILRMLVRIHSEEFLCSSKCL